MNLKTSNAGAYLLWGSLCAQRKIEVTIALDAADLNESSLV